MRAVVLATVAGWLDAVGYLMLRHLFTAHMTGNASKLGVALVQGHTLELAALVVAPLTFVAAIAAGTVFADRGRPSLTLGAETLLVAVYMGCGLLAGRRAVSGTMVVVLVGIGSSALGMQTAAFTQAGGETTRTTYVSGMLTRLGQGLVHGAPRARLALLGGLWAAYVSGAAVGASGLGVASWWWLTPPLAVLSLVTATQARRDRRASRSTRRSSPGRRPPAASA
jgi:uncharacterized membrane protein YoaK (UPF0700 family)